MTEQAGSGSDTVGSPANVGGTSSVRLVERLVARVPDLCPSYDEHLAGGRVQPHAYLAEVTHRVVTDYQAAKEHAGRAGTWPRVLAFLDEEYPGAGDDAQAVVERSFVGNLPHADEPGAGIEQYLGPNLRIVYARQRGTDPDTGGCAPRAGYSPPAGAE